MKIKSELTVKIAWGRNTLNEIETADLMDDAITIDNGNDNNVQWKSLNIIKSACRLIYDTSWIDSVLVWVILFSFKNLYLALRHDNLLVFLYTIKVIGKFHGQDMNIAPECTKAWANT